MKFAALVVTLASAWGIVAGLSLSLSFSSSRWRCRPSTLTCRQLLVVTPTGSPFPLLLPNPHGRSAVRPCSYSNARRPRTSTPTRLFAAIEEGESAANALLKMVDAIAKCKTSSDQIEKMEELEKILTQLVENEKAALRQQQKKKQEPHPPELPPPMGALLEDNDITTTTTTSSTADVDLQKAELALAQLRERLAYEEDNLIKAEKALKQSREEAETLRKAEVELLEKKKGAEQRMAEAIRRTKAFVESTEEARKKLLGKQQQQQQQQKAPPKQPGSKIANKNQLDQEAASKTNSRPTIALQQFFVTGGAPKNNSSNSGGGGKGALLNSEFPPGTRMAAAPPSVPTLYDWKLNGDGTVTGSVKGSTMFRDGAIVTTSRLAARCEAGTLVSTSSGSK
jgi:hypothetical protein